MSGDEQLTIHDATRTSFYGCFPKGYGRPWLQGPAGGEPDPDDLPNEELEHNR